MMVVIFVATRVVQMAEITTFCDIGDAVPGFSIAVVSIRMTDDFCSRTGW
jgi:hypothetical protein